MAGDSEQFKQAVTIASVDASDATADAIDLLASIGYEAADPSLQSPLWHEARQGLPDQRQDRR